MAAITRFERTEIKYLLNSAQFNALCRILSNKNMTVDQYGEHTVCSLYYDTDDYRLIRTSIEKPEYKEKLRLRSYGIPTAQSPVFAELKKKCGKVVYKRREQLPLWQAEKLLNERQLPSSPNQVLREIDYFLGFYSPSPKALIACDRIALYSASEPGFRLTFDNKLRYRLNALDLSKGDWGIPLRGADFYIMEVKICSAMPIWFSKALCALEIYPSSFSKYGTVYKEAILTDPLYLKGDNNCA